MTSVWSFLVKKGLADKLAELVMRQGMTVILLLAAVSYMFLELSETRSEMQADIEELKIDVKACNQSVLDCYKENQGKTNELIRQNTELLTRIERKLDE